MKKRGEILVENVIFIILNLIFLSILVLFLLRQGSGVVLMEDVYSKQVALLIDSAKPGMLMKINLEKGYDISQEKGVSFDEVLKIQDNRVVIKLDEKGGKEYSFFNDVEVNVFPDIIDGEYNGFYILRILDKEDSNE